MVNKNSPVGFVSLMTKILRNGAKKVKYKNANDVLPKNLLEELQKYACGEMIYIPKPVEKFKKWGEVSGGRQYIIERNQKIRSIFKHRRSIEKLADEFSLSTDSIKKIVYSK